ncbi:uncharacterized protein LOC115903690 [Camarhynchus parvulus]|uniref:uncharacterized protein LOC115903690 n=1 Tax=Geospiza parvula TaxID=87175 RepID=UPI0012380C10|nr:uncharacterized protein LOC115903690 [Camarhynchus parvulus]
MAIFTNSDKNQRNKTLQMETVQAHSRQKQHAKGNAGHSHNMAPSPSFCLPPALPKAGVTAARRVGPCAKPGSSLSPRSLRPTQPKGRPTNQQRKSRAKKIKEIRRALLPLTYILPSARGGPAADGSCSAGGDTGLTARPACRRGRAAARHPRNSVRGPSQPPPPPHGCRPSGTSPTWRGWRRKVSPGRGQASSTPSPPKSPAPGRKEERKEGGREVATQARSMLTFQYSFNSTVQSTITARKATCVPTNSQRFISLDFPSIERPLNSY